MKNNLYRGCLLLVFVVLLIQAGAARAADTYPVTGAIMLADGRAVENVAIYLDGALAARSDRTGQYMVPAASAGAHLVQPVKEGMTFVPVSIQVTLPPEAAGVNFTAFAASGGIDSTSTLLPVTVEESPFQRLLGSVKLWLRVIQQVAIVMLVLSAGAFLALAARRLRSGEWSLAFIFQRRDLSAGPSGAGAARASMGQRDWEMVTSGEDEAGIDEAFEVVSYADAPKGKRKVEPFAASAGGQEQAMPGSVPPAPAGEAAESQARKAQRTAPRRTPRIAVRRYPGTLRDQAAAAASMEAESASPVTKPTSSAELHMQGVIDVRTGNLAEGEARLRQVLQQDQDNAEAWFWLGIAKLRQGEARTAERCFLRAQRLGHPHAAAALERSKRI